jgi:hypothetical protein
MDKKYLERECHSSDGEAGFRIYLQKEYQSKRVSGSYDLNYLRNAI